MSLVFVVVGSFQTWGLRYESSILVKVTINFWPFLTLNIATYFVFHLITAKNVNEKKLNFEECVF